MKKILLAVSVLFAISASGQSKTELEEKGRKQIKTGFIIMGVGAGVALGGLLIDSESSAQGIVVLAGVTTLVTGIIIAVIGADKKARAYRMVGKVETIPEIRNGNLVKRGIPSIWLSIQIGR